MTGLSIHRYVLLDEVAQQNHQPSASLHWQLRPPDVHLLLCHLASPPIEPVESTRYGPDEVSTEPLLQRFPSNVLSIGLKSGEYGGRNRRLAPRRSMASRTPLTLWLPRLSATTMSP